MLLILSKIKQVNELIKFYLLFSTLYFIHRFFDDFRGDRLYSNFLNIRSKIGGRSLIFKIWLHCCSFHFFCFCNQVPFISVSLITRGAADITVVVVRDRLQNYSFLMISEEIEIK